MSEFCPPLGRVPSFQHELCIKTTVNGVVYLKQNRLARRYTGSKQCAVDINGKLWLKASDLQKSIRNKKTPSKNGVKNCLGAPSRAKQKYDKLSTEEKNFSPNSAKLSTNRRYFIHKREVRARILGYLNTMRGKKELYFWTVTFPKDTPEAVAYQVFNIWLTSLRQRKMLKEYIWIAERQPSTKTIHFHIAVPHKMYVKRANAMMAGTLATFAKRGQIPFSVYQCKRYNGVDLAKHRTTKKVINFALKKGSRALANYLTKYVTKNDEGFQHLAWHNSRGYSSIFTGITFTVAEFVAAGFGDLLFRKARFDTEFFTFIPWLHQPPEAIVNHLHDLNSFIQSQLN